MHVKIEEYHKLKEELCELNWLLESDCTSNHVDSQKQTWEYYNIIYGLNQTIRYGGKKKLKLSLLTESLYFNGDTDFSFKKGNKKYITLKKKLECMQLIEEFQTKRNQVLEKMEICSSLHHSLVNMSLMPVLFDRNKKSSTLNTKKGTVRFDKYIRNIDQYYKSEYNYHSTLGWNISDTSDNFKSYFEVIGKDSESNVADIYTYCRRIYQISNEVVDQLLTVNVSSKDFYSCSKWKRDEDVYEHLCLMEDYMDLAYTYWLNRKEYFKQIYELESKKNFKK